MVRIKNTMCGQRSAGWKRLAIIKVSVFSDKETLLRIRPCEAKSLKKVRRAT